MPNPTILKLKSGSIYEEKESYSRIVCVDDWILVSNTAGRNYKTREISPDPVEQAKQCFHNIEGALKAVGADISDIVASKIFIPDQGDVAVIMEYVGEKLRGVDPQRTINCIPLSSPEFKVEMEMTAYKGAGKMKTERKTVEL